MLQRLRLCRTSDTVFRREIDSRRQWGYGTCYGGIVSPLRRSVTCNVLCFILQCSSDLSNNVIIHFLRPIEHPKLTTAKNIEEIPREKSLVLSTGSFIWVWEVGGAGFMGEAGYTIHTNPGQTSTG